MSPRKFFKPHLIIIYLLVISNTALLFWHFTTLKPVEITVTTPNPENFTLSPEFTKLFKYRSINISVEKEKVLTGGTFNINPTKYIEIVNSIDGKIIKCKESNLSSVKEAIDSVLLVLDSAKVSDTKWSTCVQTCENNSRNTVLESCATEECVKTVADIGIGCINTCSQTRDGEVSLYSEKNKETIKSAYTIIYKYCQL